ncbi:lasso RiPP family leader peptide-containing protein [Kibdelosporangium persicum]|uniref:Lasso RiPP family leader peptide-containing protein n=1 Tax=Kibdelosporangium persicum TaxID=2698649 RepID=A0ABX2FHR3_9PSEU|nr:lasso RiPP family leader peptide-containing protein [Kibdelosporangium persicum]NRN70336.1 hypothetical protein [Kibdelosporangium persicum]
MNKEIYEPPAVFELGGFAEETGRYGIRNWDENVWMFDTWE